MTKLGIGFQFQVPGNWGIGFRMRGVGYRVTKLGIFSSRCRGIGVSGFGCGELRYRVTKLGIGFRVPGVGDWGIGFRMRRLGIGCLNWVSGFSRCRIWYLTSEIS